MSPRPSSAALRALSVPELVWLIVQNDDLASGDLASLARTNRRLSEVASAMLWRSMDSLIPLFQLLPTNMWSMKEDEWGNPLLTLRQRPLTRKSICRFTACSLRVKTLHAVNPGVDSTSLASLVEHFFPLGGMLPHLRVLLVACNDDMLPSLLRAPGTHLVSLTIQMRRRISASSLIPLLLRSADIEEITVNSSGEDLIPAENIIPSPLLEILRGLKRLQRLKIGQNSFVNDANEAQVSQEGGLGSLDALVTISLDMGHIGEHSMAILKGLHLPSLEAIALSRAEFTESTELACHLATIAQLPSAHTLRSLKITMNHLMSEFETDDPDSYAVHCEAAFRPVLTLHMLQELILENQNLRITADFLSELAQALPNVEFLAIRQTYLMGATVYPDLDDALLPFAINCPRLSYLALDVNVCEGIPDRPVQAPRQLALRTLNFGYGWELYEERREEEDMEEDVVGAIAEYLSCLYPNVTCVGGSTDDGDMPRWEDLEIALEELGVPELVVDEEEVLAVDEYLSR